MSGLLGKLLQYGFEFGALELDCYKFVEGRHLRAHSVWQEPKEQEKRYEAIAFQRVVELGIA